MGILLTRCPACGKIVVVIGKQHFTVDTQSGHMLNRVLVLLPAVQQQVTTITITSRNSKPVYIDGLAVLQG